MTQVISDATRPTEPLKQVKDKKCAEVDAECHRRVAQGVSYTFPDGSTGTVQLRDNNDAINVLGLGADGLNRKVEGDTSTTFPFRDEGNVTHDMTGPELVDIGDAARKWKQDNIKAAWQHKDEIRSYTTVDEVEAHDLSQYWP